MSILAKKKINGFFVTIAIILITFFVKNFASTPFASILIVQNGLCTLGSSAACTRAAELYFERSPTVEDRRLALERSERACDFGHAEGCHLQAIVVLGDANVIDASIEAKSASVFAQKACRLGSQGGCLVQAILQAYHGADSALKKSARSALVAD
ncbi:MAG: hypothetical protein AAGD04_05805 [Pseudomonadota bacterium]